MMITSVLTALEKMGHPKELIFREEFAVTPTQAKKGFFEHVILDGNIPNIFMLQNLLILCGFLIPVLWYFLPDYKWNLFDVSWYAVTLLMLIRPLGDIFSKWMIFKRLLPLRQGLGILSAAVVVTNMAFTYFPDPQSFVSTYFSMRGWGSSFAITARLAEISGFILLMTSNNFSQKLLGMWWKRIQILAYLYFFTGGFLHSQHLVSYTSMAVVAVLWVVAEWKRRK
jgi:DMSO/TMAO reductase YedYZ heme-binding membrane subunit